jgi:pimeloyl-ACP methyl ester carboxylesterase
MLTTLMILALAAAGQDPAPPYRVEPLDVTNGDVKLAGTLTMPRSTDTAVPAVVLITGSGPQNRDEEVFGFKVFATLADHLTRQGIAVYRHDDRGVGGSTGNLAQSTTEDFAGDALAALATLRSLPGIDPKRVGLIGHSEGAAAAAIAAARSEDVAFIVMLAGTATSGGLVLGQQARDMARAQGASPEQIDRIVAAHRAALDAVLRDADPEERSRLIRALVEAQVDAAPAAQRAMIPDREAFVAQTTKQASTQLTSPWMKFLVAFDPADALRKVTAPVYAAFGALDTQVLPSMHEKPTREALKQNARVTVKVYEGANHLFQKAKTGGVMEYASLEKAFVPELPQDVARWILAR